MKYFKIIFCVFAFFSLNNCSDFRDVMTGAKKKTTDEFLVKKKDPLILPPQFEKLPVPNSKNNDKEISSIKSVFESTNNVDKKITSELENMILKELRKNN